ncbi:MAG: periplasmic heavy metal sensor [Rhodobacteraceae bacterium]|nr:periplasmic heavy metal sensor [Paracoccaceae bacterium]
MPTQKNPASRSWVKILLIVSLGVNLAIIGLVIGLSLKEKPRRSPPPDAVAFLSFALPKEHRDELRAQLLSRRDELRANRAALADMRRQMITALEAKPFEISAVEEILQRQRARFLALGELAHSALLERISLLTPEERAAYVVSLEKRGGRARR